MAKEQVIGKFGNEDVVLTNAATEATLQKILQAIDKQAKGETADAKKKKEAVRGFVDALKQGKLTAKEFNKALDKVAKSATRVATSGLGHVADAAVGLAKEFTTGSARISDFTSHLAGLANQIPLVGGLIGGPFQLFASFMDNNIDTFREMSSAGIIFSNSVFSVQEAATRSGLALDVFAGGLSASSTTLALLEGNAQKGAERFTRLTGDLQKARTRFTSLGITMEDATEFMGNYLAIQTRLGMAQRMQDHQLSSGTEAYIKQLDLLTRLTGARRDELSKQMESAAIDERLSGFLASLGTGDDADAARSRILGIVSSLEAVSPEIAEAFKGLIATGGAPMNDMARSLLIADSSLGDLARRIGTDAGLDAADVFQALGRAANNVPGHMLQLSSILPQLGNNILASVMPLQRFSHAAQAAREAAEDQKSALNAGSSGLLAFEQNIVALRNTILGSLIRSDIFKETEEEFTKLLENLDENSKFIKRLTPFFQQAISWFDTWILGLFKGEKEFGEVLNELADKAVSFFAKLFKLLIRGLGKAIKELFSDASVITKTGIAIGLLFGSAVVINAMKTGILALWGGAKVVGALVKAITAAFAVKGMRSGGAGGGGGRGRGFLGRAGGLLGRAAAPLVIGTGLFTAGAALTDDELSASEKTEEVSGAAGGVAGGLAGAKLGATLGAFGGPLGIAAGGLVGGGLGYLTGSGIGSGLARMFTGGNESGDSESQQQDLATAQSASMISDAQIERLEKLVGFAPQVRDVSQSISGFQTTFNQLDLNYREIDKATDSFEKMADQLEEINNQLKGDRGFLDKMNPFSGSNETPTAGKFLSGAGSDRNEKLEDVNRTLVDILGVLMRTHDIDRRQLNATRAMTNNLYAGT